MTSTDATLTHRPPPSQTLDKPGSWNDLPAAWLQRLAGYGIHGPGDWRRLSAAARGRMFGITTSMIARLNAIARPRP